MGISYREIILFGVLEFCIFEWLIVLYIHCYCKIGVDEFALLDTCSTFQVLYLVGKCRPRV
jgi:hypothetical protein